MNPRLLAGLALAAAGLGANAGALELIGRVEHPALGEISGIVKSERGDFYWVHNDSGDEAQLFAIDGAGRVLKPPYIPVPVADWPGHAIDNASHFDWEDIALADGVLYIADVGNNGNARRDLGVYVVHEPDPVAIPKMRAVRFLPVRYPDQEEHPGDVWHFDCEAVFVFGGKLYLLTKHRQSRRIRQSAPGTKLYRLDTAFTDRQNVLTLVGRREDITNVTGADLSPDGRRLAVSTYTSLWLFDRPPGGDDWLSGKAWRLELDTAVAKQLEAVAWEDHATLRLINEQRDILRAHIADFVPTADAKGGGSGRAPAPATRLDYNFPPPVARAGQNEPIPLEALSVEPGRLAVSIDEERHELETLTVQPPGPGPFPLAVLSHGNPRKASDRKYTLLRTLLPAAQDFARRGYRAVIFARRGFASSTGRFREGIRCRRPDYERAAKRGAEDYAAVIEALRREPGVDASRIVAAGLSGGGLAVTALATEPPDGLLAVVNFAGGLGSRGNRDICREKRLTEAFQALGQAASVPALWLYSVTDRFFWPELVHDNLVAYAASGAAVRLELLGPLWSFRDGHYLLGRSGRELWRGRISAFLDALGAPNWRADPHDPATPRWPAPEMTGAAGREHWHNYLDVSDHRAFAVGDPAACSAGNGSDMDGPAHHANTRSAQLCAARSRARVGWAGARGSAEEAIQAAMAACEDDGIRCRVVSQDGAPAR